MKLTATHSFEIEVGLSGTFSRAEPQTRDDPGCDASVDDLDIDAVGILFRNTGAASGWSATSILDGVDRSSAAYRQIVVNILDLIEQDAAAALLAEMD